MFSRIILSGTSVNIPVSGYFQNFAITVYEIMKCAKLPQSAQKL
ncbi:hypothetical protein CEV31_1840 [Brucella thiophenivorans]|uniref:Uncharacterized protein n=1 Tax=Brucella thiophenivorans TaxID=571255 RepID=A0A256FXS0_9HYPH|nr:hypothetical protein CEV31_1840 [Brucella thiophenivorans]